MSDDRAWWRWKTDPKAQFFGMCWRCGASRTFETKSERDRWVAEHAACRGRKGG